MATARETRNTQRTLRQSQTKPLFKGAITAVDAGPPATVTVRGRKMRYSDGISTPLVGDVVVYALIGTEPIVLARLA